MACTKETYTAAATWTPAQLAQLFEDAFIDAGLMTAWYDSFASSGIENRVLEITYDGTKTFGKTYYWFMFNTDGVYLHVATSWNDTNNEPSGTQYLDYYRTDTNTTSYHWRMITLSASSTVDLIRYTSGVDADQSWFTIKTANDNNKTFTIAKGALAIQSWLDLDKGFFNGLVHINPLSIASYVNAILFQRGPSLRREIAIGTYLYNETNPSDFGSSVADETLMSYAAVGRQSSGGISNYSTFYGTIYLPTALAEANPAYSADSNPVFHSLTFHPYIVDSLPSDFGISFHFASNAFDIEDTLVVSSGVEEWELLAEQVGTAGTVATAMFLARMV